MSVLSQFRLDGHAALVTGGSRGLGLEIATALAEAGAEVTLFARREAFFEAARGVLPGAHCVVGDVTKAADLQRAVAETTAAFGPPSILVNAAGISWGAPAMQMPEAKIQEVLAVNITGTFLAAQAVAPGMQENGWGTILNIASIVGLKGTPPEVLDAAGYSASKGGVLALTRDLAVKWGRFGIRVNALAPGYFPTRMSAKILDRVEPYVTAQAPLGRLGRPGELAAAALYLCSPASDYVTGQVLAVDGGLSAG